MRKTDCILYTPAHYIRHIYPFILLCLICSMLCSIIFNYIHLDVNYIHLDVNYISMCISYWLSKEQERDLKCMNKKEKQLLVHQG